MTKVEIEGALQLANAWWNEFNTFNLGVKESLGF